MKINDSAIIDENNKYLEASKKILETTKENFHKTRLETDEEIQAIIPSDIACVTLSNKRAYFRGKYIGADIQSKPQGENINLSSIKNVYIQNRRRKSKTPDKVIKILVLSITALMILSCIFLANQKKAYKEGEYQDWLYEQHNRVVIGPPQGYSVFDIIDYFSDKENSENFKEIPAIEKVLEEQQRHEQLLRDIRDEAYDAYKKAQKFMTVFIISTVVCIILIIYTIIRAIKHMDKYATMQFICDSKEFGIEIKDKSILDKVKNILLVYKSAIPTVVTTQVPIVETVKISENMQQSIKKDKTQLLTELSKLHEDGLLSEEEFTKLKAEIINS